MLLAFVGASLTVALGLFGLVFPQIAADVVGVRPDGNVGYSEIRATYGGVFLGMGIGCFWLQSPTAFLVVGLAWAGATISRLVGIASLRTVSTENAVGVGLEAGIAGLLLVGAL